MPTLAELRRDARDILTARAQLALAKGDRAAAEAALARKRWPTARIARALDSAIRIDAITK